MDMKYAARCQPIAFSFCQCRNVCRCSCRLGGFFFEDKQALMGKVFTAFVVEHRMHICVTDGQGWKQSSCFQKKPHVCTISRSEQGSRTREANSGHRQWQGLVEAAALCILLQLSITACFQSRGCVRRDSGSCLGCADDLMCHCVNSCQS